ncbi:MAG: menaquinone biosynthesis decarboxylase [Rikenellaceae bacterium]
MYKNLGEYVSLLEAKGELLRIKIPVSTTLEITEITDRFSKEEGGGKALLFEKTDTDFPVLTNMMGSDRRIAMALGVDDVDEFTVKIDALFSDAMSPKKSFFDKLKMLPLMVEASRWLPRRKSGVGECQQVVWQGEEALLSRLPILFCSPYDGGRFVTLPLVHSIDPKSGSRNVGMYRMQVLDDKTTGMHWHRHKTGERHYREYQEMGIGRMPISVVLGGDPAYTYSATAPLPDNVDEYLLAGFIRNKAVELVKCITNDIEVPCDADFVIEGYVDTAEDKIMEGPFGDHTGFYSLEDLYPMFHVTCITHRRDAIYPATYVGVPPQEDAYIAKATEKIFLSPIKAIIQPDIVDMWLPREGVAHNIAIFDIDKRYVGQGAKVANSMWGAGQMMLNKFTVVTSSLVGHLSDHGALLKVLKNINIEKDIIYSKGPLDVLDHAASVLGYGGKMAIDATEKMDGEENVELADVVIPDDLQLTSQVVDVMVLRAWRSLFVVAKRGEFNFRDVARLLLEKNDIQGVQFVVLFDMIAEVEDLIWLMGNNTDAVRDTSVVDGVLVIDARMKYGGLNGFSREWPNVVTMNKETIELVDLRWNSYGVGELISSPSLRYSKFVHNEGARVL